MDRTTIETALDRGLVEAQMGNGRWWKLRRNGITKTWKTRPSEFRIPVKAGLRACAYITDRNLPAGHFRVIDSAGNATTITE